MKIENDCVVSVLVMAYNHEAYIIKCLDSILSQKTNFFFEIILGEDESTDGTREICIQYAKKHPDIIRLFLRSRKDVIYIDGSPTGRYNFIESLKACTGKYVALCDGDDYWTDSLKLQKQVDFLENNKDYVLSCHNARIIDSSNIEISNSKLSKYYKRDFSSDELILTTQVLTLTMCFRNVLASFPDEFFWTRNADRFLISMLGLYGRAKYQWEIEPAIYRVHNHGVWSSLNQEKRDESHKVTFLSLYKYHLKAKSNKFLIKKLFERYYSFAIKTLKHSFFKKDYYLGFRVFFILLYQSMRSLNFKYCYLVLKKVIKYFVLRRYD